MKVYISADIEGTNGIAAWSEADKSKPGEYNYFAARMSEEVAAVCEGVADFDASAQMLVKDAHGSARNIDHSKLHRNAKLLRGWPGEPCSMMNLLNGSFDAAIMTGYHSPAFTCGNPLAHTISSQRIARMTINGVIAGEFHINYYAALTLGVPVVMVAGDRLLTEIVAETDKDIVTVATLEGFGNATLSEHPRLSTERLRSAAMEALSRAASLKSAIKSKLPSQFAINVTYKQHMEAFRASQFPGVTVEDELTIGYKCADFFDFLRAWMFI